MINLRIERKYFKPVYTIGQLMIGDKYFCDTLEDATRDLNQDGDLDDPGEEKIIGETSIPYGRYKVQVTYSQKFKRMLPLILNVWGFIGIRIHRGNYPRDTSGCILVGENKIKGGLINSTEYESGLTEYLYKCQREGEEIYINIV